MFFLGVGDGVDSCCVLLGARDPNVEEGGENRNDDSRDGGLQEK